MCDCGSSTVPGPGIKPYDDSFLSASAIQQRDAKNTQLFPQIKSFCLGIK